MEKYEVKNGKRVRIVKLGDMKDTNVEPENWHAIKLGETGKIIGHVPGSGGEIWLVKHDGSEQVGAYRFDEFIGIKEHVPYKFKSDHNSNCHVD